MTASRSPERRDLYTESLVDVLHPGTDSPAPIYPLFPHLNPDDVTSLLNLGHALAAPPLFVHGAYWWARLFNYTQLHVYPMRTVPSFKHPTPLHSRNAPPAVYGEVYDLAGALAYAENNWGDRLVKDNYVGAAIIELRDPTTPQPGGSVINQLFAFLNSPGDTLAGLAGAERVRAFDTSLSRLTADPVAGAEMCAWNSDRHYYCARCGHFLGQYVCRGCNTPFRRDPGRQSAFDLPMPPKVIKMFEGRHRFASDPKHWLTTL